MADSPVVLGLDFGGTKTAMAVCARDGEQLASATVSSGGENGARASFERGIRSARDLLAEAAPGREPAAVGVSTFARFPAAAPLIGAVALALDAISPGGDHGDGHHVNLSSVMLSEGLLT